MVPEYLVEAASAILLGGYKGGRKLRHLALQAACTSCETFRIAEGLLNITSADVFDYRLFHRCDSLELCKLLAENFQISNDSAVCAFHRACMKGNKDIAIWLPEKYRLTRDDLFSWGPTGNKRMLMTSRNPVFMKWLVEKYQLTPADLGLTLEELCLITDGPKPGVLSEESYALALDALAQNPASFSEESYAALDALARHVPAVVRVPNDCN